MNGGAADVPQAAERDERARAWELLLAGAALTGVCTLAGLLPSWRAELVPLQCLLFAGFAILALALARIPRWQQLPFTGVAVVVVALTMRLAVIGVTPALSDDVYRYVWDGMVITHGQDPYRHAPADPALASLRDPAIHPGINHPDLRTIYPPVAEAGFALVAKLSPTVRGMKLWILLHDLCLVAVLAWWLDRRGASALGAIVYAWNPLVVFEYAGSGHHDPTALLPLVLAFVWAEKRPVLSAFALSAAVLVKLFPLLALPFLVPRWPWRARLVALACLVPGLGIFTARALGAGSGLAAFASTWRNNDSLFGLLERIATPPHARVAAGVIVLAMAAWLLARRVAAMEATRTLTRTALLVSPVVHPWYLGWALVFEPFAPSAPWLLLSCLSILSYGALAAPPEGGAFHLGWGWRLLEYGMPAALAAWLARRARAQGGTVA